MRKLSAVRLLSVGVAIGALAFNFTNCSIQTPSADEASIGVSGGNNTFDSAQDLHVSTSVPTYTGATISSVTTTAELVHMRMNHQTTQVSASYMSNNCTDCHAPSVPASTSYPKGLFHSAIITASLPAPTMCLDCHSSADYPTGFVGPAATNPVRTPSTGEMKHDAVVWVGDTSGNYTQSTTPIVTYDCSTCHQSPSTAHPPSGTPGDTTLWTGNNGGGTAIKFHTSITAASASQPTSCVDCHANTRPSTTYTSANSGLPAGASFDHSAAIAKGDCTECHLNGGANQYTSWAGGLNPTNIVLLPATDSGGTALSALHPAINSQTGMSCATCHANFGSKNSIQQFDHAAIVAKSMPAGVCITCHSRTSQVLNSAATTTTFYEDGNSLAGGSHALTTLRTENCNSCHTSFVYPTWNTTTLKFTGGSLGSG